MKHEPKRPLPGVETKSKLSETEWRFEDVPPEQLTACFFWEYCREDAELRDLAKIDPEAIRRWRVIDLRNIFLNHLDVFARLTNAGRDSKPWQELEPTSLRVEIAKAFEVFFQPIEVVPLEDVEFEPEADYFRQVTLMIDWQYNDAAIAEALEKLVRRPEKYGDMPRRTEGHIRVLDALAPAELSALRWLGMLRCTRRGGKRGVKCGPKEVARIYTRNRKPSQVSREVRCAALILDWLKTGERKYLKASKKALGIAGKE